MDMRAKGVIVGVTITLMKLVIRAVLLAYCLAVFSPVVRAEEKASPKATAEAAPTDQDVGKLKIPGVNLTYGPATVKLGKVAEIKVPEGFAFVGQDSLDKFFELTHNMRGGKEVGVLIAPEHWLLFFDYDDVGYIKDDEKKDLNAAKLYSALEEGQKRGNEARKKRGWDELKLQGWQTEPHYDERTHNLKWAFKISTSRDQYQSVGVNESIRLLGRGGVMNVTLVGDLEDFKNNENTADKLLGDFRYLPGSTYAEFRSGDKIAKIGLAALVVGGAGVVAAKAGLFAKLGALLVKGGKLIVVALIALGAGIAKLWRRIVGKDKVD